MFKHRKQNQEVFDERGRVAIEEVESAPSVPVLVFVWYST